MRWFSRGRLIGGLEKDGTNKDALFRSRRRSWIRLSLIAAVAIRFVPLMGSARAQGTTQESSDPVLAWLNALADAIVPPDQDPGGARAGVGLRIRSAMTRNPRLNSLYLNGRTLLFDAAWATGHDSFVDMPTEARTRFLADLLAGTPEGHEAAAGFVATARSDVLTLYYSSTAGQEAVGYLPPVQGYPPPEPEQTA